MTTYPDTSAGVRITADLLTGMVDNFVIKSADTTRASTVTLANDPDLQFPVTENGVYEVAFHIRFAGLLVAGIKTAWAVPSGTTGNKDTLGPGSSNVAQTDANTSEMRWAVHGYATAVGYTDPRNSVSLQSHIVEKALLTVGTTAGNVVLQWSQLASNATGTVVVANSYVKYRRIG